jgi:hypothetical protein
MGPNLLLFEHNDASVVWITDEVNQPLAGDFQLGAERQGVFPILDFVKIQLDELSAPLIDDSPIPTSGFQSH